ncbi:dihydrofolate reductase [Bacillus xiapuensis]|uniref:Dihydrofolate reductase n=1 Tax=Bacillus xiapuensis TaxID=2014075 RepID=A0ABU6N967_9BACI|nr:dihydrofolate reductase [Bacillus xiapuensis]
MTINMIAAIGVRRQLGYKNQLLCHLPNDLAYFKEKTQGNICVWGRKTFESVGKLPNRHNIILTHKKDYQAPNGVLVYHSVEDILKHYDMNANKEVELYICGGAEIYKQFLKYADRIFLTMIEAKFPKVDTYFPPYSFLDWKVTSDIRNEADENNPYTHHFLTYERRN